MAVTTRKGSATRHEALGLSLEDVKGMYRYVLMTRMVGERILQLNRMGRTPFGAGTDGHEGAQIGAAWCIQDSRAGHETEIPHAPADGLLNDGEVGRAHGRFMRATPAEIIMAQYSGPLASGMTVAAR